MEPTSPQNDTTQQKQEAALLHPPCYKLPEEKREVLLSNQEVAGARRMSAEARERIAAAQRRRWIAVKAAEEMITLSLCIARQTLQAGRASIPGDF